MRLFTLTTGLLALLIIHLASATQTEPQPNAWDLGHFDQPGQLSIFDGPIGAASTGKPVEIGDFDGDGCDDLAMTGQNARGAAGHVRLFFHLCEVGFATVIDVEAQEAFPEVLAMTTLYGERSGDMLGTELYHADFNADGYDDLLISAQNADGPGFNRVNSGAVYLLFGSADLPEQELIELSEAPTNVLAMYGADYRDRFGIWVEGGDFDGDGYPDLLIGANQADGEEEQRANAGEAWILYGGADLMERYRTPIDMLESPPLADMTRFIGVDYDDLFGSTVYGADINSDGLDDVLVSAALWRGSAGVGGLAQGGGDGPGNTRFNGGDTYIFFSPGEAWRGATIDSQTMLDEEGRPLDEKLSVIYGASGGDYMGEEIVTGDLNGDGLTDIVVGSLRAPSKEDRRIDGGEAWVVYTDERFPGTMVDLAVEGAGVPVYASHPDNKGGDTMLILDYDQDGWNDLIYGAPNANAVTQDGRSRINAGVLIILYGQAGGFPTDGGIIDLLQPPTDLRLDYLLGADAHDMSAYGMAFGDIDNDGYPDIALNGMNGDGPDNRRTDAGEIYVVSGQAFLNHVTVASDAPDSPLEIEMNASADATAAPIVEPDAATLEEAAAISDAEAQSLYEEVCAGCHGEQGEGVEGIAVPLLGSDYLELSDAELLAFIRQGRSAGHPDSKMGRAMPPSGGRPDLSDAELLAMIRYLHSLAEGD